MIPVCEVHRHFYMSPKYSSSGGPTCCEIMFSNQEPIFGASGTCYTTNVKINETLPSSLSNIRIWLDLDEEHRPSKINILSRRLLLRSTSAFNYDVQ